ncbi:barwin-like endoglucanase [Trametes cingulata]|nr:barwin-like endoglucanase [Trametes cingulata]
MYISPSLLFVITASAACTLAFPQASVDIALTSVSWVSGAAQPTKAEGAHASFTPTVSTDVFQGDATFFFQNGEVGACGHVNPDSAFIAAISVQRYGNLGEVSPLCGKQIAVTNTGNGRSAVLTIADACTTCPGINDMDLSEGAFLFLAGSLDDGLIPVSWEFI